MMSFISLLASPIPVARSMDGQNLVSFRWALTCSRPMPTTLVMAHVPVMSAGAVSLSLVACRDACCLFSLCWWLGSFSPTLTTRTRGQLLISCVVYKTTWHGWDLLKCPREKRSSPTKGARTTIKCVRVCCVDEAVNLTIRFPQMHVTYSLSNPCTPLTPQGV